LPGPCLVQELYDFAEENKAWLRVFQLPSYAPELNPTGGVWSLLKRGIVNFVATNITGLERTVSASSRKFSIAPSSSTAASPRPG
jgi:transposase